MKNWKKMIVTAAALASMAILAGCTTASAVSLEEAKELVQETMNARDAVVIEQETDRDDGVYELEIIIDGVGYEFEVDSRTGQVREMDREGPVMAQSKPAETKPVETKPAKSERITLEEAKAIAYAHAGVSEADAYDKSYERDDGVYEIDFEHGGWEYDYDIAPDGTILRSEKEPERAGAAAPAETKPAETKPVETKPAAQTSRITLDEAKAIAYAHAGVSEADAYDKSYEHDDGRYEIDFDYDGYEYEYDISYSGEILKSRKDRDDDHHDGHKDNHKGSETKPARISAQEALAIAMNHAGVTDARDKDAEWDDGRWEVSFDSDRTEYEYKISADGTILRWEKETDD